MRVHQSRLILSRVNGVYLFGVHDHKFIQVIYCQIFLTAM